MLDSSWHYYCPIRRHSKLEGLDLIIHPHQPNRFNLAINCTQKQAQGWSRLPSSCHCISALPYDVSGYCWARPLFIYTLPITDLRTGRMMISLAGGSQLQPPCSHDFCSQMAIFTTQMTSPRTFFEDMWCTEWAAFLRVILDMILIHLSPLLGC